MSAQALILAIDEARDDSRASAELAAALIGAGVGGAQLALQLERPSPGSLARIAQACVRRGLPVTSERDALVLGGRRIPVVTERPAGSIRLRLREHRIQVERDDTISRGERAELLAAAPLLEAFERGAGVRWLLLSVIEGRDSWSASIDLCEQAPDGRLDAGLQRWFPSLVGRVGVSVAVGPQLGAALHASVLLGPGVSVDGVRDLLAAQVDDGRSRWPRLLARPSFGSADCVGQPGLHLDLAALACAGPLIRLVGYYDPAALLVDDLVRRFGVT